ncbi:ABC-2 transporter permease [Undibacterium crateris]|uniref:ABC-2 transporter permease n=1 Tax=Undibacterium crateris TaxID=2528175 RepID=UPI00138A09C3|nr:ABC-2 transporter permease [Undibacterium crateris]NDI86982.1 hypothetical protein [Undibacterium crateris]
MNTLFWLIKREYWEYKKMLFRLLAVLMAISIGLSCIVAFKHIANHMATANFFFSTGTYQHSRREWIFFFYEGNGTAFLLALFVVLWIYFSQTLSNERANKSCYLWKSLPVSDVQTVMAKLLFGLLVIPACTLIALALTQAIDMLVMAGADWWTGASGYTEFLNSDLHMVFVLSMLQAFPVYLLWAMPSAGWLLLNSALAKQRAGLHALLLPLLIALACHQIARAYGNNVVWAEQVLHCAFRLAGSLLPTSWTPMLVTNENVPKLAVMITPSRSLMSLDISSLYVTPDLWWGVVAGISMIWLAALARRWQE